MEYMANLIRLDVHPGEWAREREAEGWHGVVCSDHYWVPAVGVRGTPHVWTTLATMAAHTERVLLGPSFANNLLRSPVEFCQASLSLQRDSGGRAEAALGAGWMREELEQTGQRFPPAPERARRLREAVLIARDLLEGGTVTFTGEFYDIDVPLLGPRPTSPPPLVASLGGPWTIREIAPLVDRVELTIGRATRSGSNDLSLLAAVDLDDVRAMVSQVRAVNEQVPIGMLAHVAVGDGPDIEQRRQTLGEGLFGRFVGEPDRVADTIRSLDDLGISRVQVTETVPGSVERLAPALLG